MEKIILVDGNNLLFRSYYATAYNGNFMKNSKGFPTNALFGFSNMINKIILEEKPTYILVAFDKGKTFRHEKYSEYKAGRIEMPDELRLQFPIAKKLLELMGIKYYEIENYEADDIIGTFSKFCDNTKYTGTIISSDKDLLQLITDSVDIKLLKSKDYIRYNPESFYEEYKIKPINIIDLKSLMGDSSDNIKGVKGIGEKTALKLLQEYKTLNGIYENIDKKYDFIITNPPIRAGKDIVYKILKEAKDYLKENGFITVNYAYQQDDVVIYPDLIKVKIALDDGEVIGLETTGYLNCHYTRIIPTNRISIDDARKKLSSKVEITSEGLAIIPTEWKTEKFCYEFKGKADDIDFIAYINAENGEEEDILIITNTPNGTLTE